MKRVLIADDHEIVRLGIRALVGGLQGWEVCGEASDGRQAIEMARQSSPDVAIVDIGMPQLNGFETTRQIRALVPACEVLIYTSQESERVVREALIAGARGFVLKGDAVARLAEALAALGEGAAFFSPRIESLLLAGYLDGQREVPSEPPRRRDSLSPREREVVQLIAEGNSNKQAAATLGVSTRTVETHRTKVMYKLGLHCSTDLVHYAIRNGIVEI